MSSRNPTLVVLADRSSGRETRRPRARFRAIVASLVQPSSPPAERRFDLGDFDASVPMRRLNRTRRLLGKRPVPGKSRQHARRLR
jgi:hypothetical protein